MSRYRLIGLDLDGTVLDPGGRLTPGAREAVAEAERRGVRVVLCTGRRFRTALPIAQELALAGEIVVNNGVLVKDLATGSTLRARYLPADVYPEVVATVRETGPPLVYVDRYHQATDILIETRGEAHPFQSEYLEDNTEHCAVVEDVAAVARDDVIMVSQMGDEPTLEALRARARERLGERVRTHWLVNKNYRGSILEFLATGSGKWPALRGIAAAAGIGPEAIAAVGDDTNDVEMLRGAGLGIALSNAVPEALGAADLVVGSNAEDGVGEAIERILGAS